LQCSTKGVDRARDAEEHAKTTPLCTPAAPRSIPEPRSMSEGERRSSRDADDPSPARVDPALHRRTLEELRAAAAGPRRPEHRERLEALMTDAAAIALDLDRELLLAKRGGRAALVRAEADPAAAREAVELSERATRLEREVAELRQLTVTLRRRFARRS
jgi:hypothetical protein